MHVADAAGRMKKMGAFPLPRSRIGIEVAT
jgi:hypothetical protein